jgi:SnoaL-like protein
MPWLPELFTAPALARIWEDERRRRLALVPFFAGVMTGERRALVESFAGEPELHHPVRGRVNGVAEFERFVDELRTWLTKHAATAEDVDFVLTPGRGVEELILHLDTDKGRIELPVAVASDHDERGRIVEQRMYFSSWPLTGGHAIRPPVLQPRPGLDEPDVVGDYQRALAAGDTDAVVAAFEPDASLREPAGRDYTHRGTDQLRALFELFFSNGGGIPLEHCAVTDDGRACALEYNVVAWGRTTLPPQAGLAVYVRGDGGRLAAARIYDDADPPLKQSRAGPPTS